MTYLVRGFILESEGRFQGQELSESFFASLVGNGKIADLGASVCSPFN